MLMQLNPLIQAVKKRNLEVLVYYQLMFPAPQ